MKGAFESGDLGSYNPFDCEGEGEDRSCPLNTGTDSELQDYMAGAGMYTALGLLMGVFILFGSIIFLLISICKACCCCSTNPNEIKQRDGLKPVASVSFVTCLLLILVCFCVSTFSGNYAITENTSSSKEYSAANSIEGIKSVIHTFEPSVTHAMLSSTSHVLRPTLLVTNRTVNRAVDIHELIRAFQILNSTIPRLPNANGVVDTLNATDVIIHNASDYLDLILVNLDDIDLLVDGMFNETQTLDNHTKNLNTLNDDISDSIGVLNTTISSTLTFLDEIVGSGGVVEGCVDDLEAIQRVDNGGLLPNSNVFDDASTGSTGSTSRLLAGNLAGDPAEITLMTNKLLAIDKNMSALPNYTLTANQLVYLNTTINNALGPHGLITNLTLHMTDLDNSIQGPVPILYDILVSIDSFQGSLDNLTSEMADTVYVLNIILPLIETLLPQFEYLENEVNKMFVSEDLVPVLDIMLNQFTSINETLFVLTKPFEDAIETMHDVNETLQDFLYNGTLNDILEQLDGANETVTDALAKADDELSNLEDFQGDLNNVTTGYNISEINGTIVEAISLLQSIDFNDTYQKVLAFEEALNSVQINDDFVASLYSLQDKLDSFLGILDRAVGPTGDYILLAGGYCTGAEADYCTEDADCSATTCNAASKGAYRCSSPIGSTSCTDDTDCTAVDASSYCLADTTRGTTLHTVLVGFADNSTDLDVEEILAELRDILASSDVNLTDSTNMLNDGAESINVFNTSDIFALIRDIESGIDEFDTTSIRDQMESTQESIDDVDLATLIADIDVDLFDRMTNFTFTEWIQTFETFKDFMFRPEYLRSYLANVEGPVLLEVLEAGSPVTALGHIGAQFDHALDDFRRNQTGISVSESNEPYSTRYEDSYSVLDKAGASRYTSPYSMNDQHGALYYLFALADNFTIGGTKTVPFNHPLARGIFANSEGYRYKDEFHADNDDATGDDEDSVYCLSFACFEYTMNIVNTAPLSELSAELFPPSYEDDTDDDNAISAMLADIDMSREELMTVLWVPMLLLLLIGVCAFGAALAPKCHKMHLRCNCCFLSCALLILPLIFIISSIFFLLVIVGEDSCTSGTALGETYITEFGDDYCVHTLKGTGSLTDCRFNWTLPSTFGDDANITIGLNVLDTYNALFQQKCDTAVDPFEKIASELAEQIRPLPQRAADKMLSGSDYELKPPLEEIVNISASNYGQVLYDLILETHVDGDNKVMSCETMSLIYQDLEDTGCEGVVMPSVWLVASWYFAAWAVCCCGIPASCSTLTKTKTVRTDEILGDVDEDSCSDDEEEGSQGGSEVSELEGGGDGGEVEMQIVSHNGSEHDQTMPSAPPAYTTVQVDSSPRISPRSKQSVGPAGPGVAMHMSGSSPRPEKESWVNTDNRTSSSRSTEGYVDRGRESASALGLGGGGAHTDSRFQSSRGRSPRGEEARL